MYLKRISPGTIKYRLMALAIMLFAISLSLSNVNLVEATDASEPTVISHTLPGGNKRTFASLELRQSDWVRFEVDANKTGNFYIVKPDGNMALFFREISKAQYSFKAVSDGTYDFVIQNSNGTFTHSYTLTYSVYNTGSDINRLDRSCFIHCILPATTKLSLTIPQELTSVEKIQGEITVATSNSYVEAQVVKPDSNTTNLGKISSQKNIEIPGQIEGIYSVIIKNPSGNRTSFRINYTIEPYIAPQVISASSPSPSQAPAAIPPVTTSRQPTSQPSQTSQSNSNPLAWIFGIGVVVAFALMFFAARNKMRKRDRYRDQDNYDVERPASDIHLHFHEGSRYHKPGYHRCDNCGGTGKIRRSLPNYLKGPVVGQRIPEIVNCPDCDGTGRVWD